MKTHLLTCLALCGSLAAQAQWVTQPITFAVPEQSAYTVEVIDANAVWARVDKLGGGSYSVPKVINTADGGQTWQTHDLPLNASLEEIITSISAVSATTAWVTTVLDEAGSRILKTTDGGQTWTAQGTGTVFTDKNSEAGYVHFFSATEGVAIGMNSRTTIPFEVYRTTDGGQNWTAVAAPARLDNQEGFLDFQATSSSTSVWLTTNSGRVLHSADRGQTWNATSLESSPEGSGQLTGIAFQDEQNGLIGELDNTGTNNLLYRTTDGGQTWSRVPYSGPLHGISISAVPGTTQYVSVGADLGGSGDQGSSYSRDNGQTWVALENTINHVDVQFISPTVGWSSSLRIENDQYFGQGMNKFASTILGTRPADATLQAGLQLVPNPAAHGRSSLRASRPFGSGPAQVRVLDVTGRLVKSYTWTGSAALELDLSREKTGLYLLEVSSKTGTARQKLLVE